MAYKDRYLATPCSACGGRLSRSNVSGLCRACSARALPPPQKVRLADRFWSHVDRSGDCWLWTGSLNSDGYGHVKGDDGRTMLAHRASWLLARGDAGAALVLHRCDNPPCCNPAHLFLGTQADNVKDMYMKNRDRFSRGRY